MKGGGEHAARGLLAQQLGQAQAQLAGGAHAERRRKDLARRRAVGGQQVRDAVGERAGRAAAGTGEDQQRAGAVTACSGVSPVSSASGLPAVAWGGGGIRVRVGSWHHLRVMKVVARA